LIAYLRLLHDPADIVALARLVARPPLSVDLEEALRHARDGVMPEPPLNGLMRCKPTARWAEQMLELSALKATHGVDDLLFELLNRTRYLDLLLPLLQDDMEAGRVMASVSRFADFVSEYCERRRDHSLSFFVEHLDLVLRSGLDEDVADVEGAEDAVQLMTIHQAKGLQFDLVFVPALVDGRLPQSRRRAELPAAAGLDPPAQPLAPGVR